MYNFQDSDWKPSLIWEGFDAELAVFVSGSEKKNGNHSSFTVFSSMPEPEALWDNITSGMMLSIISTPRGSRGVNV